MTKKKKQSSKYLVLTPTEEKIVWFLGAQKNPSSISHISREIGLARTSIYNAINSLIKKRLVRKNGFKYNLITKLKSEDGDYNEKNKINALLDELLELKKGEIIYSIESDGEIEYLLNEEGGAVEWQKTIANKGIVLKGIGSTEALKFFKDNKNKELDNEIKRRSGTARFIEDPLSGYCNIVSFRNSVIFFSRKKNYFYRINNEHVAKFVQIIMESFYLKLEYKALVENAT